MNRCRRSGVGALAACAVAAVVAGVLGCGNESPALGRAVIGFQAPPLADVRWVPAFALGAEPSVFNEGMLQGKVVLLDFYASW